MVNFHGGGFVFGALAMSDWLCSNVAAKVGAVVVSVDYRLAPRNRFPAAVDDCYAGLAWAADHAGHLGSDGPAGVMGESAGGNLSAVVCLLARDRGGPVLGHQTLLYPATDLTRVKPPPAAGEKPLFLSVPRCRPTAATTSPTPSPPMSGRPRCWPRPPRPAARAHPGRGA